MPDALPPVGPARDRLVAEVVGWVEVPDGMGGTLWLDSTGQRTGYYTANGLGVSSNPFRPSECAADALAALLAWKARVKGTVTIIFDSMPDTTYVRLEDPRGAILADANDDTLPAAATTALVATRGDHA